MRLWKIAISIALVAAVVAPFLFGTWKNPISERIWVPLTEQQTAKIATYSKETDNCSHSYGSGEYSQAICRFSMDMLRDGGSYQTLSLRFEYWLTNLSIALATLVGTFALIMILPSAFRRYLDWLKA